MQPTFTDRLVVGPDVLFRMLGDESVLLNLKSETYFGLDALGTRVWTVLVSAPSIQTGFDTLLDEFEVTGNQLRADLVALIDDLVKRGLVIVESTPEQGGTDDQVLPPT